MGEAKLKPCPFCGRQAEVQQYGPRMFSVQCANRACRCLPGTNVYTRRDSAVRAWNKRAAKGER